MKKFLKILLTIIFAHYLTGLIGWPFLFIITFNISLLILILFIFRQILFFFKIRLNYKKVFLATVFLAFLSISLIYFLKFNFTGVLFSPEERIKSLNYLTWTKTQEPFKKGVTKYNPQKSFKGANLYCSSLRPIVYLMDMTGKILHTWTAKTKEDTRWQVVEFCQNGDLLCIKKDQFLLRQDWDSKIKWVKKIRAHHDIAIDEQNDIYILARKDEVVFLFGLPFPITNDYIVVLSLDGNIKQEISLFKILKDKPAWRSYFLKKYFPLLMATCKKLPEIIQQKIKSNYLFKENSPFDILHSNKFEIIPRDIKGLSKKGDLLISVREINLIGILNRQGTKLIWSWGENQLRKQHAPSLLENNNILVFDNQAGTSHSQIVELDPFLKKIVWKYKAEIPNEFYSSSRGFCQRLPNGNTLITESNRGRVFEITKNKEIVWEFYNPEVIESQKKRAAIYRLWRITDPKQYPKLKDLK